FLRFVAGADREPGRLAGGVIPRRAAGRLRVVGAQTRYTTGEVIRLRHQRNVAAEPVVADFEKLQIGQAGERRNRAFDQVVRSEERDQVVQPDQGRQIAAELVVVDGEVLQVDQAGQRGNRAGQRIDADVELAQCRQTGE